MTTITFDSQGTGHCLYMELIDLKTVGSLNITRATNIEFNHQTENWEVKDLQNQLLFNHPSRQICLEWEQQHFT